MELVERESLLGELEALKAEAAAGQGRLVMLSGDAGAGKTAAVKRFCADRGKSALLLMGACDPIATPRPLGPLVDMAPNVGGQLGQLLRDGADANRVVAEFLLVLTRTTRPLTVVLEDVHWADQATFDLLCVLGRRVGGARALVIATFREDGLQVGHPLRQVLGELATSDAVRRIEVAPLTVDAVRQLVNGTGLDPAVVHRQTGGNAFFVTEIIASGATELPPTVRDAVLARAQRLSDHERRTLQAISAFGSGVEVDTLARIEETDSASVEAGVAAGLLAWEGRRIGFRHELARAALERSMPPPTRVDLHRRILVALRARGATPDDLATLAWHAEEAGDAVSVLELAPAAAQRAQVLNAHREAAAQYARAVRFAWSLPIEEQAVLLESWSREAFICADIGDAVDALERALSLRRELGQRREEGSDLQRLALLIWNTDRRNEALSTAHAAVDILTVVDAPRELAAAYATVGALHAQAAEMSDAAMWAEKAIQLAQEHRLVGVRINALRTIATARLCGPLENGWPAASEALEISLAANRIPDIAASYEHILWFGAMHRNFAVYDRYWATARDFGRDNDLALSERRVEATHAVELLHRGSWTEAGDVAGSILRLPHVAAVDRIQPLYVLGRLRARRGDPDAWPPLDEALRIALPRGDLHHLGNVRAARAGRRRGVPAILHPLRGSRRARTSGRCSRKTRGSWESLRSGCGGVDSWNRCRPSCPRTHTASRSRATGAAPQMGGSGSAVLLRQRPH